MRRGLALFLLGASVCCHGQSCQPPPPPLDDIEPVRQPLPHWELAPHRVGEVEVPADGLMDGGLDAGADAGTRAPADAGTSVSVTTDGGDEDEDDFDDEDEDAGPPAGPKCPTDGGRISCTADCWCAGPSFDSTGPLLAVAASGSGAWAIGSTLLRYDGRDWEEVSSGRRLFGDDGEPLTTHRLPIQGTAIWAAAADDVWIARGNRFMHWDGDGFSRGEGSASLLNTIDSMWGTDARHLWAVGVGGVIAQHDDSGWSSVASGTTETLTGVAGSSATDVWAVGTNGTVLHWDGASWQPVESGLTSWLTGVWVSPAGEVWIVGNDGVWRGGRGGFHAIPLGADFSLSAIWGDGEGRVWAVGGGGVVIRFEGGGFRTQTSGTILRLHGVAGGDGKVYAVGDSGALLWHVE